MERRLAGAVTAGGVAGAVAGGAISSRKSTRQNTAKDSRGNTTSSMGQRAGSKVGAVLDTKNRVKDKANAVVGNNKMYHAGDPIGYADLNSSYWQQHLIGAGRVKQ